MRLKALAQWNQTLSDWERFLSASPEGCFVAECDGAAVGTATTILYARRFAWIGMVLVDPGYRGQGIGTALLERAIQHVDSRHVVAARLDATPQGKPLYQKLGFVAEYAIERWMLERLSGNRARGEISRDIDDVFPLDREVFGADRSALLRSLAAAAPEFALVAKRAGGVVGYAFGRHGSLGDHLGPWVARDEAVAADVLDEFLRRSARGVVFVDCVQRSPWGVPLVQARGFRVSRLLTRMFRGANEYPGRPELLGAVLGPEFG